MRPDDETRPVPGMRPAPGTRPDVPWRRRPRAQRWDRALRWMTTGFFASLVIGTILYFAFLGDLVEPAILVDPMMR